MAVAVYYMQNAVKLLIKTIYFLECAVYGFVYRYIVLVRFIVFSVVVTLYFV